MEDLNTVEKALADASLALELLREAMHAGGKKLGWTLGKLVSAVAGTRAGYFQQDWFEHVVASAIDGSVAAGLSPDEVNASLLKLAGRPPRQMHDVFVLRDGAGGVQRVLINPAGHDRKLSGIVADFNQERMHDRALMDTPKCAWNNAFADWLEEKWGFEEGVFLVR